MASELKPSVGSRLREERERLGLSQTALASVGGASKSSQIRYEAADGNGPDCAYLGKVAEAGVDVAYVLTGKRAVAVHARAQTPDLELLQVCLAGVEEGLEATGRVMAPDKKAQLVTMLYDLHQAADSPPQKATILQFIKRAA